MKCRQLLRYFKKYLIYALSIVYILFLFKILFLGRNLSYYTSNYDYNVIPLKTIMTYIRRFDHYNFNTWFNNLFGNILLFIPFGFFSHLLFKKFRLILYFSIFQLLMITFMELMQMLLHVGSFDIDDIILNSFGGYIGYVACHMLMIIRDKITKEAILIASQRRGGIT